jgi:hypothetical protein
MILKNFINFFKKKKKESQTYEEPTTRDIVGYELDIRYLREQYGINPISPNKIFGDHVRDNMGRIIATINQSGLAMTPDGRIIGYRSRNYQDPYQPYLNNPKINDRKQFKLKRK